MLDLRIKGKGVKVTTDVSTINEAGEPTQRKKQVNIGLTFACDTDEEAMTIKAKVNDIAADNPNIQVVFGMIERPNAPLK